MSITTAVVLLLAILVAPVLLIRFRKRWVAAFNLALTNRITSRFAARLPGFGILTHIGRKSGRVYRTPVNIFRAREGFLIALTSTGRSIRLSLGTSVSCCSSLCGVFVMEPFNGTAVLGC